MYEDVLEILVLQQLSEAINWDGYGHRMAIWSEGSCLRFDDDWEVKLILVEKSIQVVSWVEEFDLYWCLELDSFSSLFLEGLELLAVDDFGKNFLKLDSFSYDRNGMYGIYASIQSLITWVHWIDPLLLRSWCASSKLPLWWTWFLWFCWGRGFFEIKSTITTEQYIEICILSLIDVSEIDGH